jgi:flagellin
MMATDVTKSPADLALYNTEFEELTEQLNLMLGEEFNDIALFDDAGLTVVTSHDGEQEVEISQSALTADVYDVVEGLDITSTANATTAVGTIQTAIQNLANLRATNGAEQSRLSFAADMLSINKVNLESANSRIIDVDVADESTKLARFNILQQAGTAMLAQANQSTQSILRLLS